MEKDLLKLINESAKEIENRFKKLIEELAYSLSLRFGMPQEFYINYLMKRKRAFFKEIKKLIYDYLETASFKAYDKIGNWVDRFFGNDLEQSAKEKLLKGVKININKDYISKRIWKYTDDFFYRLQEFVQSEAWQGRSALTISEKMVNFLNTGLNEKGELIMKVQGRGIYRDPVANAMRLVRTEVNRAYRKREHNQIKRLNFVKGIKINLSASHPKPDICDDLQGEYPKDFVFTGWHPHCICYPTYITVSKEEAIELIRNNQEAPQVKINRKFRKWVNENKQRWQKGEIKKPLFIVENEEFLTKNKII